MLEFLLGYWVAKSEDGTPMSLGAARALAVGFGLLGLAFVAWGWAAGSLFPIVMGGGLVLAVIALLFFFRKGPAS